MANYIELKLWLDADPTCLSRVFGLLSTMSLIPDACVAHSREDETVEMALRFEKAPGSTIDLLMRKFQQLPQTIELSRRSWTVDHIHQAA